MLEAERVVVELRLEPDVVQHRRDVEELGVVPDVVQVAVRRAKRYERTQWLTKDGELNVVRTS